MRYAAIWVVLVLSAVQPSAQTTAASRPVDESRFEVISIKPLPRGSNVAGYLPDPARFIANGDIAQLLFLAYQVPRYRIVDMPEWTRTERYVINATIASPRQPGDLAVMVRHMLEDRFALRVHRENRLKPVFVLSKARSDGRLGPKLQPVTRTCIPGGKTLAERCYSTEGIGTYYSFGRDWASIVTALERFSDRAIVDETGLSGQWDLSLEWNPEITQLPDPTKITSADLEARPIWSTAVREQLGLKLETRTAPTDVLVVERLERPTPD